MAKDKPAPAPLITEYQRLHKEKFAANRYLEDLKTIDFPTNHLQHYPSLHQTCIRVNTLYARLSKRREELIAGGCDSQTVYKKMKRERRIVAPQLLLGLRDLNIACHEMGPDHRKKRSVHDWYNVVRNDLLRYRNHEPVFALYLKYLQQSNVVGANLDSLQEAFKMRADMRELLLAVEVAGFPIGQDFNVFRHVNYEFCNEAERQKRVEVQKITDAKSKLEEGLEEWLAIGRHIETLSKFKRYDGNEQWQSLLQRAVSQTALQKHIDAFKYHIEIADSLLQDRA